VNAASGHGSGSGGRNVLAARPGGIAEVLGRRLAAHRLKPAAVALWAIAFVILGAVIIGLGLLLTRVLLHGGLGSFDVSVSRWFVRGRTPALDTVTRVGTELGSTGAIIGVAALALIVLAIGKHWRQIGFLACAMTLEFGIFVITTLLVGRHRPTVLQLDAAPPTSSYPSGHMASALALYVGLAIVVWSLVRGPLVRRFVWAIAVALSSFVGVSRLYRGMHFLTDVIAAVLLGCLALVFALLITRTMREAAAERDRHASSPQPLHPPPEAPL